LIKLIKAEQPKLPILVVSTYDESIYTLRILRAGALGYLMRDDALTYILEALYRVATGSIYSSPRFCERLVSQAIRSAETGIGSPVENLSDRELEVVELLGCGLTTKEMASKLHLSVKTIETHRARIKDKLGFRDSGEMVRFALGWVTLKKSEQIN
jgi:DNA-binding NarL/FixJ family response regulator